jgi:hypothetical protein
MLIGILLLADSLLTRRNAEQQRLSFGEYLKYQRDVADIVIR